MATPKHRDNCSQDVFASGGRPDPGRTRPGRAGRGCGAVDLVQIVIPAHFALAVQVHAQPDPLDLAHPDPVGMTPKAFKEAFMTEGKGQEASLSL